MLRPDFIIKKNNSSALDATSSSNSRILDLQPEYIWPCMSTIPWVTIT